MAIAKTVLQTLKESKVNFTLVDSALSTIRETIKMSALYPTAWQLKSLLWTDRARSAASTHIPMEIKGNASQRHAQISISMNKDSARIALRIRS